MQIRRAEEADFSAIESMGARFYGDLHYNLFAEWDPETAIGWIKYMADPQTGVLLLAEQDGEIVGMIGLLFAPFHFNKNKKLAAEMMWWTAPEARKGTNAGLALLRAVTPACEAAGCSAIQMVHLVTSPPQAGMLYERMGFQLREHSYWKVL